MASAILYGGVNHKIFLFLWLLLFYMFVLSSRLYLWVFLYDIYPTPPLGQDKTQGQFLSGV